MRDVTRRPWGTGSLYQRSSDGRWIGRVEVEDGSGRRRQRYVTGRTKAEARARLSELRTASRPQTSETLGAYLARWLDTIEPNVRPRTHIGYRTIVDTHVTPSLGGIRLAKLSAPDVQAWVHRQLEAYSPRSVGHQLACLRTALGAAVKWGILERNVASLVSAPRVVQATTVPLTVREARRLLASVEPDRLSALYVLAVTTGMRQGELLGLRWQDVDLDRRQLAVRQNLQRIRGEYVPVEPKTDRSRRTIPLSDLAVGALERHRRQWVEERTNDPDWIEQGLVFTRRHGSPVDASQLGREFTRHLEAAGLPRVRFHDLRHTAASLLLEQGLPMRLIADILGHSSTAVTDRVYAHLSDEGRRRAADSMDEMLAGNG